MNSRLPTRHRVAVGISLGRMTVFDSDEKLAWGALNVPLFGLTTDWDGQAVDPPAGFSIAVDTQDLWFIAHHRAPASLHPLARPGTFQAELWKHDVAELFLHDPASGRYLELNLAPNGAWWSCEFTSPRVRDRAEEMPIHGARTYADMDSSGAWVAALQIPLDVLRARIGFGQSTCGNVTMILGSPNPRFLSAADLGGGAPDFHRPAAFPELVFVKPPR